MILWRWLRVLAGLLAVSIFVGLPYPGAFASDDDDEILLKRSSVGSLLSNRNKAEGARVAAPSDPPPAVTPAEPAREPEAQAAPAGKGRGRPHTAVRDAGDEEQDREDAEMDLRSGKGAEESGIRG